MTVSYTEVTHEGRYGESPAGEWYQDAKGRAQFRATRLLKCAWTDRIALIAYLMSEAGGPYPHADGTTYALVRGIKPRGRGQTSSGGTNLIAYTESVLEVFYTTEGPRWVNGLYLNEAIVPERVRITPPGPYLRWHTPTRDVEPNEKGVSFDTVAHVISVGRAVSAPSDALTYIGCCNATTKSCFILPYTFASQTMLFGAPNVTSHTDYSVGTQYTYTYSHVYNPHGWNKFWRTETGAWEFLYDKDDNVYVQYPVTW